jgi:hypothetical protein
MAVGVAEVDGGGRHPTDDARLGGLDVEEGARRDACRSQPVTGARDIIERSAKSDVKETPTERLRSLR